MHKAAGILGIVGGVFGFFAAILTLFLGGLGSAFDADGAGTVVGLGWGGVVFSFLCIIFGALIFSGGRTIAALLIASAILGGLLGGTLVAVCMALPFIGGILGLFATHNKSASDNITSVQAKPSFDNNKKSVFKSILIVFVLVISGILLGIYLIPSNTEKISSTDNNVSLVTGRSVPAQDGMFEENKEIAALQGATHNRELRPDGRLAEVFALNSSSTNVQRKKILEELKGQVVIWSLPISDIKKNEENFLVTTDGAATEIWRDEENSLVSAQITIVPRTGEDIEYLLKLNQGDFLQFKGLLTGDTTLRHLEIKPAIVWYGTEDEIYAENNLSANSSELIPIMSEQEIRNIVSTNNSLMHHINFCKIVQKDLGYRIIENIDYEGFHRDFNNLLVKSMRCGGFSQDKIDEILNSKREMSESEKVLTFPLGFLKQGDPMITYKFKPICETVSKQIAMQYRDIMLLAGSKCEKQIDIGEEPVVASPSRASKTEEETEKFYRDVLYPEMNNAFENKFKHDLCLKYKQENKSSKIDEEKLSYADKIFQHQYKTLLKRAECMGLYSDNVVDVKQDVEEELLSSDMGSILETAFYAPVNAPANRKKTVEQNCLKLANSAYNARGTLEKEPVINDKTCK